MGKQKMNRDKIRIILEYDKSIDLYKFSKSLEAVSSLFNDSEKIKNHITEQKLHLEKAEKGSLILDLIVPIVYTAQQLLPTIKNFNAIKYFYDYLTSTLNKYKNKNYHHNKDEYSNINKQTNSNIKNLTINNYQKCIFICSTQDIEEQKSIYTQNDFQAINQNATNLHNDKYANILKEENVVFKWDTANFTGKKTNRVIISEIDSHPQKVIFQNDPDKSFCQAKKNWQNLNYICDVLIVKKTDQSIHYYKIINIHQSETEDFNNS